MTEPEVRLSVLDRLLGDERAGGQVWKREDRLSLLRDAVRRDVEALVNTRERRAGYPDWMTGLRGSLLEYGAPDFTAMNLSSHAARVAYCRRLETLLRTFEPRLSGVSVTLRDEHDAVDRAMRLRVSATITAAPELGPVTFDTVLDGTVGTVALEARDG